MSSCLQSRDASTYVRACLGCELPKPLEKRVQRVRRLFPPALAHREGGVRLAVAVDDTNGTFSSSASRMRFPSVSSRSSTSPR